jgi:hypothetical protein
MSTLANATIALALLAAFAGGFALFWIAGQDDSRAGRLIGALAMLGSSACAGWLIFGPHWL